MAAAAAMFTFSVTFLIFIAIDWRVVFFVSLFQMHNSPPVARCSEEPIHHVFFCFLSPSKFLGVKSEVLSSEKAVREDLRCVFRLKTREKSERTNERARTLECH